MAVSHLRNTPITGKSYTTLVDATSHRILCGSRSPVGGEYLGVNRAVIAELAGSPLPAACYAQSADPRTPSRPGRSGIQLNVAGTTVETCVARRQCAVAPN